MREKDLGKEIGSRQYMAGDQISSSYRRRLVTMNDKAFQERVERQNSVQLTDPLAKTISFKSLLLRCLPFIALCQALAISPQISHWQDEWKWLLIAVQILLAIASVAAFAPRASFKEDD